MTVADVQDQIAIVGMSGRFPGARTLERFWRNLRDGVESITFYGAEELQRQRIDRARLNNPNFVPAKSHLDDQELFDAGFFGYSPQEAELIDPQQRIFLESAWEALEHAGYVPETFAGPIGLFAGANQNLYLWFNLLPKPELLDRLGLLRTIISNGADYLVPRAAYKLNLTGPCCTVQSACSTSLVAVHLACQSLLNFECDLALAGGVSLNVAPFLGYNYEAGGLFSRDGHTRTFDARAGGTVFGEGVGIIVLKRLEDALNDRDTIHAVVRGSAVNNDGSAKAGFTALGMTGQATVIHQAIENAGISADSISYLEAHGTATELGDAIEVKALTTAFRHSSSRNGYCAIGSVKSNIGHLTAAAGVAGLIKTVLAMQHRELPPTLHFERPNPNIDFASTPFVVNAGLTPWAPQKGPRRAGINAFGIGGTNAHVIVEEAPAAPAPAPGRPSKVVVLSARSDAALGRARVDLAAHLRTHPELPVADVAHTLSIGRRQFRCRLAVTGATSEAIAAALESSDPTHAWTGAPRSTGQPVVFVVPDACPDLARVAHDVAALDPTFKLDIDRLCARLLTLTGRDLRPLLQSAAAGDTRATTDLQRPSVLQPATFIVELSLARLLMRWGVKPVGLLGTGIGEYVAACLAGICADDEGLGLAVAYGALTEAAPVPATRSAHAATFRARVAGVRRQPPAVPIASSVTGAWMTSELVGDAEYWVGQALGAPLAETALETLLGTADRLVVNIGSGAAIVDRITAHAASALWLGDEPGRRIANASDPLATIGQLWVSGVDIDWATYWGAEARRRVPLPTYPFERQRYWSDPYGASALSSGEVAPPLLAADDLADSFSVKVWRESTAALRMPAAPSGRDTWLVFADTSGVGEALVAALATQGQLVVTVVAGDAFVRQGERKFVVRPGARGDYEQLFGHLQADKRLPTRLVHLWSLDGEGGAEALTAGAASVAHVARLIAGDPGAAACRLLLVTSGGVQVLGEAAPEPSRIAALGPLRVLSRARSNVAVRGVDVERSATDRDRAAVATRILGEAGLDDESDVVAWRRGRRWVSRREAVHLESTPGAGLVPAGTWCAISGASDGPGLLLAAALARRGPASLVLVERAPLPDRAVWPAHVVEHGEADPVSRRIRAVMRLEALGARVVTVGMERWEAGELRRAIGDATHGAGAIGMVIHAEPLSGAVMSDATADIDVDRLTRALADAAALVDAFPGTPAVLCTSRDAERGLDATPERCALHVALDALATNATAKRDAPVMTVAWDRWRESFDERTGLDSDAAVEALVRAATAGLSHVTVSPARDARSGSEDARPDDERANVNVAPRGAAAGGTASSVHQRPVLDTPFVEPATATERDVAAIWAEMLGIDRVGIDDHFIELGGDSLLATQIVARLRTRLNVELSLREVMDQPTVRRMAAGIAARALGGQQTVRDLVLALDDMSDEEAAAQLLALTSQDRTPEP